MPVERDTGLTEGEVIVERPGEAVLRGCIFERGEEGLQLFWAVQARNFTWKMEKKEAHANTEDTGFISEGRI